MSGLRNSGLRRCTSLGGLRSSLGELGALLGRLFGVAQVASRVDERDVRESLRKVSEMTPRAWIILLAQKSDIVAQRDKLLEEPHGIIPAAEQQIGVRQPEAASEEGAFAGRQAVFRLERVVAQHQSIDDKSPLDRRDGAAIARVVGLDEANWCEQQQAGI